MTPYLAQKLFKSSAELGKTGRRNAETPREAERRLRGLTATDNK
jgi:hypothetical protein